MRSGEGGFNGNGMGEIRQTEWNKIANGNNDQIKVTFSEISHKLRALN